MSGHDLTGLLSNMAAKISQQLRTLFLGWMTAACDFFIFSITFLQCFDTVGWPPGRAFSQ